MLRNYDSSIPSGKLTLYNLSEGTHSRGLKAYKISGNNFEPAAEIQPNEVFVLAGKTDIKTGDLISPKNLRNENDKYQNLLSARRPSCSVILEVSKQGKEKALIKGLETLCKESCIHFSSPFLIVHLKTFKSFFI